MLRVLPERLTQTIKHALGRSLPALLDIADEIRAKGSALTVGHTAYDPADPAGAMMVQVLGMAAEFEVAMNRNASAKESPGQS